MQYQNILLAVRDIARSKLFYRRILGLSVILDVGANVTLTGGICLQSLDSWQGFLGEKPISFGGNASELYFEEADFDDFIDRLHTILDLEYVHPVIEHRWGQRAVRFYDPDRHIIEVAEPIALVCRRFHESGMTAEEIAERMDVPEKFVFDCI